MVGRVIYLIMMVLLIAGCESMVENINQNAALWQKPSRFTTDPNAGKPSDKTLDLGSGVRMEFVLIPAGSFAMGSPDSEKGRKSCEGPVRQVQITRPFYLGKYEVTQDQYAAITGKNPNQIAAPGRDYPQNSVTWGQAAAFCAKVGGRLPTEAEWEYACRAGSSGRFCFGDSDENLKEYAWYSNTAIYHPVGLKKPNSFVLYDMHGNAWEWCQDYWAKNYQDAGTIDPKGPSPVKNPGVPAEARVVRGGEVGKDAADCRCASRWWGAPFQRNIGFRVALDYTPPQ